MIKKISSYLVGPLTSRVIVFLSMILIARIYSPDNLGLYALIMAISGVSLPLSNFKLHMLIPIAKGSDEVLWLSKTAFTILGLFLIFFYLCIFLINFFIKIEIFESLLLCGAIIALNSVFEIFMSFFLRKQRYLDISKNTISATVAGEGLKIFFGLVGFYEFGLILGIISYYLTGTLLFISKSDFRLSQILNIDLKIFNFTDYRGKASLAVINQFLMNLGDMIPVFFIGLIFSQGDLGLFSLAFSVIGAVNIILSKTFSKVYFSESALEIRKQTFKIKSLIMYIFYVVVLCGPFSVVLYFFGENLFEFIYGNAWIKSGTIAKYLSIILIPQILYNAFNQLLILFNKQSTGLFLSSIRIFVLIIFFVISQLQNMTILNTLFLYSVASSLLYLIMFIVMMNVIRSAHETN